MRRGATPVRDGGIVDLEIFRSNGIDEENASFAFSVVMSVKYVDVPHRHPLKCDKTSCVSLRSQRVNGASCTLTPDRVLSCVLHRSELCNTWLCPRAQCRLRTRNSVRNGFAQLRSELTDIAQHRPVQGEYFKPVHLIVDPQVMDIA